MIVNAIIKDISIGYEDHGILTFHLGLNLPDNTYTTFGGWSLDKYDSTTKKRVCENYSMQLIAEIMKTVGVTRWEDLKEQYIRVDFGEYYGTSIKKIGHIMEDKWFSVSEFIESYMKG